MKTEKALNQFIDILIINNGNLHNIGLKLYTTVRGYIFYVYRNDEGKIFINPKRGSSYFEQPTTRILDVLNDESIINDRDLPYVIPIVRHIKKHYLME